MYVDDTKLLTSKSTKTKKIIDKDINKISKTRVKNDTSGIVDRVVVTKNRNNSRRCKIRIRKEKVPTIGDKYATRHGQKGMCGMVLQQRDMPYTKDGLVPDIIINPHAFPSRLTINYFLELILGKVAVNGGYFGDSTPFMNVNQKGICKS